MRRYIFYKYTHLCMFQNIIELGVDWQVQFLDTLNTIRDRSGLLEIGVNFTDTSTEFNPPMPKVMDIFAKFKSTTKLMFDSIPRIVYTAPFKFHIMNVVNDAPRVSEIVHNSNRYVEVESTILETLRNDFEAAARYTQQFDIVRPIFDEHKQWDHEGYVNSEHTVESMKADLDRVAEWDDNLDRNLRPQHVLGILYVETRNLKRTLRPLLDEIEGDIKNYLKKFTHQKCTVVLEEFRSRLGVLNDEPKTLKQFAEYVKKMTELASQNFELMNMVAEITEIQELIQKHNVKLSAEHKVLFKEIETIQDVSFFGFNLFVITWHCIFDF